MRDTALLFADDLANALRGSHGASLYVGAAVAELPLILADHLVLGRAISWVNLDSVETRELTRAIELVSERMHLALPRAARELPRIARAREFRPHLARERAHRPRPLPCAARRALRTHAARTKRPGAARSTTNDGARAS
jgi:hypothetical protein